MARCAPSSSPLIRIRIAVTKYKYLAIVSLAMVLLAMIPQLHLWLVRGRDWNGGYVVIQGDETLYSGYLNALIQGRTRRNDSYAARDDSPQSPLPESTFSIQFIPPYVIAFLARLFHASASTAMIVLMPVAALLGSLCVYWLFHSVTNDDRLAAAGTIFVLCLGGLSGGHGLVGLLVKINDLSLPSLPFLRRYQPAASFPVLIAFFVLFWQALTAQSRVRARASAVLAGLALALLIFSYLYLWTAAVAWVGCVTVLWLLLRKDRWTVVPPLTIVAAIAACAFAPYLYLLSHRPATLDEQQTLAFTRRPDLFRIPEIIAIVTLILLFIAIRQTRMRWTDAPVIFAASFALLPLLVFNQQVVTGRIMQPYHFAALVVNYTVLISLFVTFTLWRPMSARALLWVGTLCFAWGLVEVGLPSRLNTVPQAVGQDQMVPVLLRLKQLSNEDGTVTDLHAKGSASTIIFSPQIALTEWAPTWTSQGTLPDAGGIDFGHITRAERKQYFYLHLYYAKADIGSLREALKGNPSDQTMKYYARAAIFGHERIVPALASDFRPITDEEIESEITAYQAYANSFSRAEAVKRPLTYVVIPADSSFDFSNIDRWYERDTGERVGEYVLYRVRLKVAMGSVPGAVATGFVIANCQMPIAN
jgi:hypothetical protein